MKLQIMVGDEHNTDPKHQKAWRRLMSEFKREYLGSDELADNFKEAPIDWLWHHLEDKRIIPISVWDHHMAVACGEITWGGMYGIPCMSLATIYVKPTHRHQGIAQMIYQECDQMAKDHDELFAIQVEQSTVKNKWRRFVDQGFTSMACVTKYGTEHRYQEPCWLLFRRHTVKRMLAINEHTAENIEQYLEPEVA